MLLAACGLVGDPTARWAAEAGESAVLSFVGGRTDPSVPAVPLTLQTTAVYSAPLADGAGPRVWQVRSPRADIVALPLLARDRLTAVEYKADVVIAFEERYCWLAVTGQPERCEPWQPARCCEQVWLLSRGAWTASGPAERQ